MNTLKFANTNGVYFRVEQPEHTFLTQKINNEVRAGLALMNLTSMISDLIGEGSFGASSVARKLWFVGIHKDLPRENVFSCFLQSIEF